MMQINADRTEEGTHEGTYPLPSLPRRRRLQTMQHALHHGIVRARLRDLCPVGRRGSAAVGTTNKCERTFVIAGATCASTMYSTDIQQLSTPCNSWLLGGSHVAEAVDANLFRSKYFISNKTKTKTKTKTKSGGGGGQGGIDG